MGTSPAPEFAAARGPAPVRLERRSASLSVLVQSDSGGEILRRMGTRVTAPNGNVLHVEWDDGARLWLCWPEGQPNRVVACADEHLTGSLAEALGFDVAHDDLPRWLGDLAGDVRASVPR